MGDRQQQPVDSHARGSPHFHRERCRLVRPDPRARSFDNCGFIWAFLCNGTATCTAECMVVLQGPTHVMRRTPGLHRNTRIEVAIRCGMCDLVPGLVLAEKGCAHATQEKIEKLLPSGFPCRALGLSCRALPVTANCFCANLVWRTWFPGSGQNPSSYAWFHTKSIRGCSCDIVD